MVNAFYDRLRPFQLTLQQYGYDLRLASAEVDGGGTAPVMIQFPTAQIGQQTLIVLPDVHLAAGNAGDVFYNGSPENPRRLTAVLKAMQAFSQQNQPTTLLQLGDWYDVWRSIGADATSAQYSPIDNVAAYQELLGLDKALELAHCYGNHDASFTHALPDRRVADQNRFRFGFGLLNSKGRVYALHGHQADSIQGEPNSTGDIRAVWLGTVAANYLSSKFRSLEEYMDKEGNLAGAKDWLLKLLGVNRDDPVPVGRPAQPPPNDGQTWNAKFVKRESMSSLVAIAQAAVDRLYTNSANLEFLIVGHSHKPCVGWTSHPKTQKPVVVIDCGAWVYGQANLMFAAGNVAAVYDIVKFGTP
ncbi:MAG: metallophosphoesterase [Polyangiaceae bacterium]